MIKNPLNFNPYKDKNTLDKLIENALNKKIKLAELKYKKMKLEDEYDYFYKLGQNDVELNMLKRIRWYLENRP